MTAVSSANGLSTIPGSDGSRSIQGVDSTDIRDLDTSANIPGANSATSLRGVSDVPDSTVLVVLPTC
jgi:hypothetical protein